MPVTTQPHRRVLPALLAVVAAGSLLAACGGSADHDDRALDAHGTGPVASPTASSPPARGEGSKDPDDINGDGHPDLVLPLHFGEDDAHARLVVVFGSAKGLDPATRTVYGRRDLGFGTGGDESDVAGTDPDDLDAADVTSADLDSDGFPDLVTAVSRHLTDEESRTAETQGEGIVYMDTSSLRVAWGDPGGPQRGARATPIQDTAEGTAGLEGPVRGDFDGDGHHDLAALRQGGEQLVLMYGPFSRSGVPARTETRAGEEGWLKADAIEPTGKPRATALMVHQGSDGEQSAATLYTARTGSGPAREGRRLREGNAVSFGDFDGDGHRDVAIGDDGSRNDEPGYETEEPDVDGSLTIYPGDGGAPRSYPVPGSDNGDYGPGGYHAADPDGDGRDAVVVSTDDGALLIDPRDGRRRTEISRTVPARMDGKKVGKHARAARPFGSGDFDGDGASELVFAWGANGLFDLYGENPTHWWIADGVSARDKVTFSTVPFAPARG